jgi:hypothetical protein
MLPADFLRSIWLPHKHRQVRTTTAYRYTWFVERYVVPAIGDVPLRRLRADHLNALYECLATAGGRHGDGLAPKTMLEVHMIPRVALDLAVQRRLLDHNVAHSAHGRRRRPATSPARSCPPKLEGVRRRVGGVGRSRWCRGLSWTSRTSGRIAVGRIGRRMLVVCSPLREVRTVVGSGEPVGYSLVGQLRSAVQSSSQLRTTGTSTRW